jgi:hypothetical protein
MTNKNKKIFLTPKELIPHVLDVVPNISEYTVIEINPKKNLPELLTEIGLFESVSDAKKAGFKGKTEAAMKAYDVNGTTVVILV